ncbi:hypothetical protein [Spirillospora sp. CA-294931]|uniref:hypothetical protein n=1 Tax=Spirillospora sp. CA-294931 TaxID=3240042 RepID=UPI003D91A3C3
MNEATRWSIVVERSTFHQLSSVLKCALQADNLDFSIVSLLLKLGKSPFKILYLPLKGGMQIVVVHPVVPTRSLPRPRTTKDA